MKTNIITIRPDRLNAPLVECWVGRLSSAVFVVTGDIPDDITGITIQVGRTPDPQTQQPRENFAATATRAEDGTFRCYLAPWYFPDIADLEYHVVGQDDANNPRWLGTGSLLVKKNPANGSPIIPPIVPPDTYVRNPATGLYHKVNAEVDEYRNITLVVEKEGVVK